MITEQEMKDLAEIHRLLDEAYDHYFKYSDGYCKSSEGHIGLDFNNFFERRDGDSFGIKSVEIYSYVFGPNRSHYFKSTAEALKAVQGWHEREMQEDYLDNEEAWLAGVEVDEDPMPSGWDLAPEYNWLSEDR